MKIAVIGAGNMGGATALGLAAACPELGITVTARHAATLEKFAARGLHTSLDNPAAAREADIVILGVKPWLAKGVLEEILPVLDGKLLISLVAGIPAAELQGWIGGAGLRGAYTVIPNLAERLIVCCSVSLTWMSVPVLSSASSRTRWRLLLVA